MSVLTNNGLTPEQDLLCREFYQQIIADDTLWPTLGKTQGTIASAVLQLLGYTVSAGVIVPIGTTLKFTYGQSPDTSEYAGIFDRDKAIVEGMLDDTPKVTINVESSDEAGASESPEGDAVGDVLLEDV
jgi:hypothetical protein